MKETATVGRKESKDGRPAAIGSVWVFALAMLGVCIPLVAIMKSVMLPFVVVGGATIATVFIWRFEQTEAKPKTSEMEVEEMRETISRLEERLANVEVINRFEERLAEREMGRRVASVGKGEVEEEERRLARLAGTDGM